MPLDLLELSDTLNDPNPLDPLDNRESLDYPDQFNTLDDLEQPPKPLKTFDKTPSSSPKPLELWHKPVVRYHKPRKRYFRFFSHRAAPLRLRRKMERLYFKRMKRFANPWTQLQPYITSTSFSPKSLWFFHGFIFDRGRHYRYHQQPSFQNL
jgi:hypothetical protein